MESPAPARYLTSDVPGIDGAFRSRVEDFLVEEVPLYAASGIGEHTYFEIEKRDLSTFEAIARIARALGVKPHEIGSAGLKDSRAVARQVLSVGLVPLERVARLQIPGIQIRWVSRHTNKLRIGHLKGNRFAITLRGVRPDAASTARRALDVLEKRGVPNYFGPQRFGLKGDTHVVGGAFLRRDWQAAIDAIVGGPPSPQVPGAVVEARSRFRDGRLEEALALLPAGYDTERRMVRALIETRGDARASAARLPRNLKFLYLSAYQAHLFNQCLNRRLETIDRLYPGDLALKHVNGAVFQVLDPAVEQPRAEAFEISPSGPIFGYKMIRPSGLEGEIEDEVLAAEGGIDLQRFDGVFPGIRLKGERRALRFPIREITVAQEGDVLVLSFFLPRGCYATAVLRELMKGALAHHPAASDLAEESAETTEAQARH